MEPSFLSVEDICERYSIKHSTVYEWCRSRGFPAPLKLGKLSRWKSEDLTEWEAKLEKCVSPAPEAQVEAVRQRARRKKEATSITGGQIRRPIQHSPKQHTHIAVENTTMNQPHNFFRSLEPDNLNGELVYLEPVYECKKPTQSKVKAKAS